MREDRSPREKVMGRAKIFNRPSHYPLVLIFNKRQCLGARLVSPQHFAPREPLATIVKTLNRSPDDRIQTSAIRSNNIPECQGGIFRIRAFGARSPNG